MSFDPPTEPAAFWVYEVLAGGKGFYQGSVEGAFVPGPDGTDDVCHLETQTLPEMNDQGVLESFTVELFFSRSGTALLQLADQRRARYSKVSSSPDYVIAMFFELEGDPKKGEETDVFEGRVFEVVVRPNPWFKNIASMKRHILNLPSITLQVPELIGFKNDKQGGKEFREKLYDAVERSDGAPGFITALALNTVSFGLRFAGLRLVSLAHWLNKNSRMPKGFWNPEFRPPAVTELRNMVTKAIQEARNTIGSLDLGLGRVAVWAEELPLVGDLIGRINAAWAQAEMFFDGIASDLESLMGSAEDTIDTVIAYVCGLWDGIIEAIIGMLEFAGLILRGLAALLSEKTDLGHLTEFVREATDEVIQAFSAVNWARFGDRFMKEIAPMIVEVVKKKVQVFIDEATRTPAVAAYYFGYLVYMIVEFFFPPLKFGQVAKAARVARVAATARFLGKVTG